MRVLIDTNIFIHRENDHIISYDLQQLLSVLNKLKTELLIHPLSLEEIKRDQDTRRQAVMLSKVGAYPLLEMPPVPGEDHKFFNIIERKDDAHDLIDNHILYTVYKDAVDFLVTEDRDIHKKAIKLGIDNRVLLIAEALTVFRGHLQKDSIIIPPALERKPIYNLNLSDPFFDSLKEEYPEFDDWFKKIKREGRNCLVNYKDDGSIGALLVYKFEDEPIDATPKIPRKKRIKLSTFKVAQFGYKIGELFIKLSIDIAISNGVAEVYLTHFIQPDDRLIELITEYGFRHVGTNSRGEAIYMKQLFPEPTEAKGLSPFDITKLYYPSYYDGADVKKFIVPILPQYHSRLFTNYKDRQIELAESAGYFIVEGNTIRKAYICNSRIKRTAQGDLILFYVSERRQLISVGIVEAAFGGLQDYRGIIKLVGKRTVYSVKEIQSIAKKPSLVILFWQYWHLRQPLSYLRLKGMGILKGPPRSIMQISEEEYSLIKEAGEIDERFTIN
jgi:predicted nucleic acid-binding protein